MSHRLFPIFTLLFLLVTTPLRAQWGRTDGDSWVNTDYNTTEGTDFWLTFMFNYGNTEDDIIDLHLRVFATARQNARVTIHYANGTTESFNVKAFSRAQHDIDIGKGYVVREKEVERKGIHVTSTVPISLYAVSQNAEAGSQDATNVLPTKALQKEYVIQTYGTDGVSTEFALVATKYVSNITINVKKTHNTNPSKNSEDIVQTGAMYPGDVYLYRSNGANYSLSGTKICSDVPVAVFVGGQHADIPIRTSNKNHIYSQAMPTDMWGKTFVASKTYGQRWDYLRFTAAENNTNINVYDEAINNYKTRNPNPLDSLDTYQDSIYSQNTTSLAKVYNTNKAVETFLYLTDFTLNSTGMTPEGTILGEGSPAMTPINPIEQGTKSLVFTTLDAPNIQNHYVNIATYYNSRNNIQLDNTNIGHLFKRINGTPYAFLDLPIDTGAHFLVNTNPTDIHGVFTAHVYGLGQPSDGTRRESYAYSAGSRIERSIDMLIDGQYIKQKDVCIPNTTTFTPVINQDFKNYHWQFDPINPVATPITSGNYTTINNYSVQFPDTGRWDVSLIVNYSTPLCANIITDTVKAIINMHDTVHIDRGYNDLQARDICYGEDFYVHYERGKRYDYIADTSTIQHIFGRNTKFELNKEYVFKDTLENKWGCDSIIWQHVTIRPTYDTIIYDTTCYQHLPYEWRREDNGVLIKTLTKNDLYNKHNLHLTVPYSFNTDSIITSKENLHTRYGCDSLVTLKLLVMPDYLIDDGTDQACQDSIYGYNWSSSNDSKHKHTDAEGKVLAGHRKVWMQKVGTNKKVHILPGQYISLKTPGTYTLVDSLKTSHVCRSCDDAAGCDSVHVKTIVIQERKQKILPKLDLCDNHYIVALNDTLCVGYKYKGVIPEPWKSANRYIVVNKDITLVNHSSTQDVLQCDSITMQQVHICRSYENNPIVVSLCQGTDKYDWKRADNGKIIQSITIPSSDHYPVSFNYTDTLTASGHCNCDSIVHLTLTINPTYDTTIYDTICDVSLPYKWIVHDNSTNKDRTISISRPSSETSNVWHTTRQETLHTKKGCDSIVHLDLIVYPTIRTNVSVALCPEQLPYQYCENGATVPANYTGGTRTETLSSHQFPMSCDSIVTYHIVVSAENVIDIPIRRCDDDLPYSYVYPTLPSNATHTRLLTDIRETGVYSDTVSVEGQCRTIYKLNFIVDKTYNDTLSMVNVCVNNLPYSWRVTDKKGNSRTISITIPDNVVLPFDTLCTASLKTIHSCDSTVHLPLRVHPTYTKDLYDTICEKDLPYPWKDDKGLSLKQIRLTDIRNSGQWKSPDWTYVTDYHHQSQYSCDSLLTLHLTVYPTVATDTTIQLCPEQLPYQYCENGATVPANYTGGTRTETLSSHQFPMSCDSVVTYHIIVSAENVIDIPIRRCDDDLPYSYVYPTLPSNATHTRLLTDIRETGVYSDTVSVEGQCRTIYRLNFTVDSTYDRTLSHVDVCEDDLPYRWHVQDTKGTNTDIPITIPVGKELPFDTICVTTLQSIHGCDSVVRLPVTVRPHYSTDVPITICERELPYPWKDNKGIVLQTITSSDVKSSPTWHEPEWLYTSDYTHHSVYGCDSVLHLHLTVKPTVESVVEIQLCPEQLPYKNFSADASLVVPVGYTSGEMVANLTSERYKCDSIVTYQISVSAENIQERTVRRCDNNLPYNFDYGNEPAGTHHTFKLEGLDRTDVYHDTVSVEGQCRTIYRLNFTVDSTYDRILSHIDVCEDDLPYRWHVQDTKGTNTDIPITIPVGKELPFDTICVTTLQSIHGCDSVVRLPVTVRPHYSTDVPITICERELPYLWKDNKGIVLQTITSSDVKSSPTWHEPEWLYTSDYTHHSAYGCDSVLHLHLTVKPTTVNDMSVVWCASAGPYPYGEKGKVATETGDYIDTLITKNQYGCDSILHLHVEWKDSIYFYDTVRICDNKAIEKHGKLYIGDKYDDFGGTYTESLYDSVRTYPFGIHRDTITFLTSIGCDSTFYILVDVQPTHYSQQERNACQFEDVTYEAMHNGLGGKVPTTELGDVVFMDTIPAEGNGCDSIINMTYHIRPHYHFSQGDIVLCQADSMWIWYNENGDPQDTISLSEGNRTYNLGTEYKTIYGCDSTYGILVYVAPIHHIYDTIYNLCEDDSVSRQGILFVGREFDNYHPNGIDESQYRRVNRNLTGRDEFYIDTAQYYTNVYGCDSVYHFAVKVNPVYRKTIELRACQTDTGFYYNNLNRGVGGYLQALHLSDSLTRNDTLPTISGCDSIITLHFYVDSVYHYGIAYTYCQDTIDTMREWIDEEGRSHGWVLDISKPGNYRIDSVLKTIHGCDSTFGVQWHVDPIYRFDTIIEICEDGRFVWQDTLYTGDSVRMRTPEDSVILAPGIYHRFKHFETVAGCDSDYYATIYVHPIFDTLTRITVCESDGFVWHQDERPHGQYHTYADTIVPVAYCDTIRLLPYEADLPQPKRDTTMRYYERMLQTVHGCDSLSRIWVTVQPTYCFLTDTTICANDRVKYRGKYFTSKDTIYVDRQYTEDGCDSTYILRLHVRPTFMNVRRVTMCDNEVLYHHSQNHDDAVWNPGDEIRDPEWEYYDMIYTDANGCDSIYRYYLTIYPAFHSIDSSVVMCSVDTILLHGDRYVGERIEFPVDTFVQPYTAYYGDTLRTIHDCDSVYGIYATIYPAYRHRDTITICDDDTAVWREHTYGGLEAGEYTFLDSYSTIHGCDSIYELRLIVKPTYLFVENVNKCADEDMTWHGYNLDHLPVGNYFFFDSLTTVTFGCDSVHHLYLTVNDTTSEIRHDTICRSEIYDFHGKPLTEPGYYYDTTLNEWGCHHYTHLYLTVIEPIIPTAWADSICANDSAYDLFYTYTGDYKPIAFSLKYDEEGHRNGFEDIIDQPITHPDELSWLRIPMPNIQEDSTKYPKPNYYRIKFILDNGICTDPDLCSTDTFVVLSYPSWITRQRFGDVIALYNDKYNGGYHWWHYQWYHGDELLVGETHEYLYVPTGLIVGDEYHVRLTREGETMSFQTCPITIVPDPVNNDFAPNMGYLATVQSTCVCHCNPIIYVLARRDGYYRLTYNGLLVDEGTFRGEDGATPVLIQNPVDGMYIIQLWSPDTPEEPYRAIKIFVKPQCPNYENIPF